MINWLLIIFYLIIINWIVMINWIGFGYENVLIVLFYRFDPYMITGVLLAQYL